MEARSSKWGVGSRKFDVGCQMLDDEFSPSRVSNPGRAIRFDNPKTLEGLFALITPKPWRGYSL